MPRTRMTGVFGLDFDRCRTRMEALVTITNSRLAGRWRVVDSPFLSVFKAGRPSWLIPHSSKFERIDLS